jgi:hypothetical protein
MSGFGVICQWKDGVLLHGGVNRPKSTIPKSELVYLKFCETGDFQEKIDFGKDCEPVSLSHHAGCIIKVSFQSKLLSTSQRVNLI